MICTFYPCSYMGWYYRQHILRFFCMFIKFHYYLTFSHISHVHITTFLNHFISFVEQHSDLPISYETIYVLLPWLLQNYHLQTDKSVNIQIEIDIVSGDMFHIRRK